MNPRKLTLSLSLPAVLLIAGGAYLGERQAQVAPVNLQGAVAVVDIDACLLAYPPAVARQAKLVAMRKELQKVIEGMTGKLKAINDELIMLKQGSPAWMEKTMDLRLLKFRREQTAEQFDARFSREYDEMRVALYAEMTRGIEAYSKQTGLQLVLRLRPSPKAPRLQERVTANAMRELLYSVPALDETKKVIKFLKGWNPK